MHTFSRWYAVLLGSIEIGSTTHGSFNVPQGRQRSKFKARLIVRGNREKEGFVWGLTFLIASLTFNGRFSRCGESSQKVRMETSKHLWVTRVVEPSCWGRHYQMSIKDRPFHSERKKQMPFFYIITSILDKELTISWYTSNWTSSTQDNTLIFILQDYFILL